MVPRDLLRQRVVSGACEMFPSGYRQYFDEPQTCHNGESMGVKEIGELEALTTEDRDFKLLSGAEHALYLR